MGLDMYLTAEKYVGGWDFNRDPLFDKLIELTGITPTKHSPSFHVDATIGYWRKANAIHRWFVEHVQDGEDNCQRFYVAREQLIELKNACLQVLDKVETVEGTLKTGTTYYADGRVEEHTKPGEVVAQPEVAASILPTQEGFFFGGTDYDEYYLHDLRETVEIIQTALDNPALKDCDFYYRSSW